jgi:hypothetical protein
MGYYFKRASHTSRENLQTPVPPIHNSTWDETGLRCGIDEKFFFTIASYMEGHKAAHGIVLRKITSHTALAWNKLGDFLQQQTTGSVTRPLNHRTHVHLLGNKSPVRDVDRGSNLRWPLAQRCRWPPELGSVLKLVNLKIVTVVCKMIKGSNIRVRLYWKLGVWILFKKCLSMKSCRIWSCAYKEKMWRWNNTYFSI